MRAAIPIGLALILSCSPQRQAVTLDARISRIEAPAPEPAHESEASNQVTVDSEEGKAIEGGFADLLKVEAEAQKSFKKAILATLQARNFEPVFTTSSGTTLALEALINAVQKLPEQGVSTEDYPPLKMDIEGNGGEAARARLEILAMSVFFRYALDMKFFYKAHPFKAFHSYEQAETKRLDDLVSAFIAFANDPTGGLEQLKPKHPYYTALIEALARYRSIADQGDFPEVQDFKGKLKRGSKGAVVRQLKARLKAEGYFSGDEDNPIFDIPLAEAWRAYQSTHGYEQTGEVEPRHLKSLNIPAAQRVKQIELSLQRWRESEVRHEEPLYVRVNIPEFMMELWEDGELRFKHRIVCGNNNWDKDVENRIEGRINRTKLFSAVIERIVINPKWHVPVRIQKEELDWELLKDPTYYVKHNFKVKVLPDGREEIYQESGIENALGRVKFVFPNPYGIFMHDTNQKDFFKREIRAFSHGCIRLQNPVVIAKFLLERCANMTEEAVNSLFAQKEQREIELKKKVPIFVEYNTVGVDQEGRTEFFSDVYGYDKDFFDGKIPYSEEELRLLLRKIPKVD